MSEMDVIRAFCEGEARDEAPLKTDGIRLYSGATLLAEKRGGDVHVAPRAAGRVDAEHRALLLDFMEWRKQRDKVLRALVLGKGVKSWASD